jgi:hypothetical protein
VPARQRVPLPHFSPAQQGWPAPPQAWQVPARQASPAPGQPVTRQQGWLMA